MKKQIEIFKKFNKGRKTQVFSSIIFTIIASIVVALNLTGLFGFSDSVLLSIIIVLLCSVIIAYILDQFDISGTSKENMLEIDSKLSSMECNVNEMYQLLKDAQTTKGVILSRRELEQNVSLESIWKDADEVYLLAIANTSFLQGNGISRIQDAINRGVKFKMVSLAPDFSAIKEYDESGIISPTSLPVNNNVNLYIKNCKNSGGNAQRRRRKQNNFKDMVELRLTTFLLPYSMMIVRKEGKTLAIKIDLYGVDIDYLERRSFFIAADDTDNIRFYEEQWKTVWENTEKTTCIDLTRTY